jgi:hypothetical protein
MKYIEFIAMTIVIVGIVLQLVGFHNVDNGFNMSLLAEWELEYFIDGEIRNARDTYLQGVKLLLYGHAFLIFGFLLLLPDRIKKW